MTKNLFQPHYIAHIRFLPGMQGWIHAVLELSGIPFMFAASSSPSQGKGFLREYLLGSLEDKAKERGFTFEVSTSGRLLRQLQRENLEAAIKVKGSPPSEAWETARAYGAINFHEETPVATMRQYRLENKLSIRKMTEMFGYDSPWEYYRFEHITMLNEQQISGKKAKKARGYQNHSSKKASSVEAKAPATAMTQKLYRIKLLAFAESTLRLSGLLDVPSMMLQKWFDAKIDLDNETLSKWEATLKERVDTDEINLRRHKQLIGIINESPLPVRRRILEESGWSPCKCTEYHVWAKAINAVLTIKEEREKVERKSRAQILRNFVASLGLSRENLAAFKVEGVYAAYRECSEDDLDRIKLSAKLLSTKRKGMLLLA